MHIFELPEEEPSKTLGEHANCTYIGPRLRTEPTTFLLWGSCTKHCATVSPLNQSIHPVKFWPTCARLAALQWPCLLSHQTNPRIKLADAGTLKLKEEWQLMDSEVSNTQVCNNCRVLSVAGLHQTHTPGWNMLLHKKNVKMTPSSGTPSLSEQPSNYSLTNTYPQTTKSFQFASQAILEAIAGGRTW